MLIEYRVLKADAAWDFSYLAASQVVVESAELCITVQVALLDHIWLICGALRALCCAEVQTERGAALDGLAGLGALWQLQARVCALGRGLCQVPKQVPNSARCTGEVWLFFKGNEEPFYHPGLAQEVKSYPEIFYQLRPAGSL